MNHSKKKILIVDDDKNYTDLLETWFSNSEYEVMSFNDSAEALRNIEDCKPDLILLDLMLPKLNGIQLMMRLKNENILSKICVISSADKEDFVQRSLECGALDQFVKPVFPNALAYKLKQIL